MSSLPHHLLKAALCSSGRTALSLHASPLLDECGSAAKRMSTLWCQPKGDFAKTAKSLKLFYGSGEPEMSENCPDFPTFNCPLIVKDSGKGLGMFLEERALPGQLIFLIDVLLSCYNTEDMPYETDSWAHAPEVVSEPPRPRIPSVAHQTLADLLAENFATASAIGRATINMMDSHPSPQKGQTHDRDVCDMTEERLVKAEREHRLQESEAQTLDPPDSEKLWNVIFNNAMCDKMSSLSLIDLNQVNKVEIWGLDQWTSLINHSCSPNCHRIRIGNSVIIRAATNIAAGDELTLPYFDIFQPLAIRDANCETFGFRCECQRCTFERSIGRPYDDIQKEISRVTVMLQTEWTVHVAGGTSREIVPLLKRMSNQCRPIRELCQNIGRKWLDEKNQREQNGPPNQKGVLRTSRPRLTSYAASVDTLRLWIEASFIESYIALYALCETGIFSGDSVWADHGNWRREARSGSEEAARALRVMSTAKYILGLIIDAHPGNMLGQEFYSILLKACNRFVQCDLTENIAANTQYLLSVESDGMRFFSTYYGYVSDSTLRLLLATKS